MRICFYSPYLPNHFGGGEKYLFDTALVFAKKHKIFIAINTQTDLDLDTIKEKYALRYGEQINKFNFIFTPLGAKNKSPLIKFFWTGKFDALYYVSDGSLFFSLARKNILHLQIPFTTNKIRKIDRLKLSNWSHKVSNSYFTKKYIEKFWQTRITDVVQPGINLQDYVTEQIPPKEKIILNVGRFFQQLHSKKQDVLVDFFRELIAKYPEKMAGWRLVLAGPIEDHHYAQLIAQSAADLPVEIIHHLNNEELINLYQRATIYWHATGFDIIEDQHPEKMEHFGITTVEAMAAGCIPVVIGKGGQPEILGRKLQDCLWTTKEECLRKTISIISKPRIRAACAGAALARAQKFSTTNFSRKVNQILTPVKK